MSLGNDLATIRQEKNLSLEDIFEVTKIPVHTLKSIENDTLLKSSSESKTYLRSFIRSYAKALKISDQHILAALKATEDGSYNDTLIKFVHPQYGKESEGVAQETLNQDGLTTIDPKELTADTYEEEIESNEENTSNTESKSKDSSKPTVNTVNWADMSKKVYASPANSKIGLLLIVVLIVGGLGAASYFYGGDFVDMISSDDSSSQTNTIDDSNLNDGDDILITNDSTFTDNADSLQTTPPVLSLPETLTVTLYAAYDKLDPVRVTSDFNNRTNPFWMNKGDAYYFDFNDTLLVRGQYPRFLLMYNGNVINNPRQNHYDSSLRSIVITRDILSAPEYQINNANNFPTNLGVQAPDTVIYRLDF